MFLDDTMFEHPAFNENSQYPFQCALSQQSPDVRKKEIFNSRV